jgi:hypothetical protein
MDIYKLLKLFSSGTAEENDKKGFTYLNEEGLFLEKNKSDKEKNAIPPHYADLARLHILIRSRKVFSILEFGLGWSTIVMADALSNNKKDWEALDSKPLSKSPKFELHAVDTSEFWIKHTVDKIPGNLQEFISFHYSKANIGTFQDRVCHYYEKLPDITPDFIYLDGPDPATVEGTLNGITFSDQNRIVIAADLLRLEPSLLPGTMVLVDGRTANVRFLAHHLYRNWKITHNPVGDITVFELQEPSLGEKQRIILKYQLGESFIE